MAEELVAIDDSITTESVDDWEEQMVRSHAGKMTVMVKMKITMMAKTMMTAMM